MYFSGIIAFQVYGGPSVKEILFYLDKEKM